jgi:hypothetical protein
MSSQRVLTLRQRVMPQVTVTMAASSLETDIHPVLSIVQHLQASKLRLRVRVYSTHVPH